VDILIIDFLEKVEPWVRESIVEYEFLFLVTGCVLTSELLAPRSTTNRPRTSTSSSTLRTRRRARSTQQIKTFTFSCGRSSTSGSFRTAAARPHLSSNACLVTSKNRPACTQLKLILRLSLTVTRVIAYRRFAERFVAKKAPRESKAAWFKNNCEAIVLVPQSKDVAKGIFHGQETLAILLWRFCGGGVPRGRRRRLERY